MTEYSQQILSVISSLETQLETLKYVLNTQKRMSRLLMQWNRNEQDALAEKIANAKDSSVSKEELDQIKATVL
jgi:hypothetical protein